MQLDIVFLLVFMVALAIQCDYKDLVLFMKHNGIPHKEIFLATILHFKWLSVRL